MEVVRRRRMVANCMRTLPQITSYLQFIENMLTITDLGAEIILFDLLPFLSASDIAKLSSTCKALHSVLSSNYTYHQLYLRNFGNFTPLNFEDYNWKEIFQLRCSKDLYFYTWGAGDNGRLGYLLKEAPPECRSTTQFGIHTPVRVTKLKSSKIEQISSGGYSFQVLISGEIYCIGSSYCCTSEAVRPGPQLADYSAPLDPQFLMSIPQLHRYMMIPNRRPLMHHSSDNPNLRLPPEQMSFPTELNQPLIEECRFVTKLRVPRISSKHKVIIKQIASGRTHIIALDTFGEMYVWDSGNSDWKLGVHITLVGLDDKASKVKAGWNSCIFHSHKYGLVYWQRRMNVTQEEFEAGTNRANAIYHIVSDSKSPIDFVALESHVVYINSEGLICYCAMTSSNDETVDSTSRSKALPVVNKWLSDYNKGNNKESSFTKLSGYYKSVAAFTDQGSVLVWTFKGATNEVDLSIIPELQNSGIIDVVMGDYHNLAMTDKGDILSWGLEPHCRGCLGLGPPSTENHTLEVEGKNLRVRSPTKVHNPTSKGKWLAVTAAGWHSGGLYIEQ